ncbi:MAG: thiamine-phosphate kinase [Ktedonobacteraceae bacterium]|nr:thiamine-phosphate kinase [Ktedonobacteraceae bacterium]
MKNLGEFELIARLTQGLHAPATVVQSVGDDCALLDVGGKELLLATCDSQVEGVHFTLQTSTSEQIGRKALAINLSDIAAMGGVPRYALVSLILPAQLSLTLLDGIYAGLHAEAQEFATAIVGGNISGAGKGELLIIDITLLGTVERGHALLRSGARPGDRLFVTGTIGDSAAGLHTLLHPDAGYPQGAQRFVQERHLVPRPRIAEGRILSRFGPAIVTAMLDISDGLSGDLGHICERSHTGARIELAHLPLSPALQTIAQQAKHDPYRWALHGGEDYELLFTADPAYERQVIEAIQEETGTAVTCIGTICEVQDGMKLVHPDGHEEPLSVKSWDHLKAEDNM